MADTLPDLERFVRGLALFQQRFLNEADAAAQRPPAGTAAASAAAAPRTALPPAAGPRPRRAA